MSDDYDSREEICPDCQATPDNMDVRILMSGVDKTTGRRYVTATWHLKTCPQHTVDRVLMEDDARRVKEQDAWAAEALPAAFDRLRRAAAAVRDDAAAAPFAAALVSLVAQQAEDTGRFVPACQWAEILDRHFPPQRPGEPTA